MVKTPLYLLLWLFMLYGTGCKTQPETIPVTTSTLYKKGEALLNVQNDSAFYYFNEVANTSADSLEIAMAYNKMAIIQADAGDHFGSQESLLASLRYLNEKEERNSYCLFSDYNELGFTSLGLKNYTDAIRYFDQALRFIEDADYRLIPLNNKALSLQRLKNYDAALRIYDSIFERSGADTKEYARVLSNRAKTKWLKDPRYNALPEFHNALSIRKKEQDKWGLTASYIHLSDYYATTQKDSALWYAENLCLLALELESPEDELDALQRIIQLENPASAQPYFNRYLTLNDSLQTSRSNARNQFALIRYEAEKHRAENLELQKQNAEKKFSIFLQWAAIITLVALLIIAWIWFRKSKQQALREQLLKTSQKVHDLVANGLYRLMAKVEHGNNIEKEELLDDIEILYEQSRDISYDHTENTVHGFHQHIAALLQSFSNTNTSVSIVGNTPETWQQLSSRVKAELKHVLQELMVNMRKHSRATTVVIKFEPQEKELLIRYTDDGVGLPENVIFGNGLTGTENRIRNIGGRIIFEASPAKALHIQLFVPTQTNR